MPVLIHLFFIGTETPQHDQKVIESPFEYSLPATQAFLRELVFPPSLWGTMKNELP